MVGASNTHQVLLGHTETHLPSVTRSHRDVLAVGETTAAQRPRSCGVSRFGHPRSELRDDRDSERYDRAPPTQVGGARSSRSPCGRLDRFGRGRSSRYVYYPRVLLAPNT